MLNKTETKDNWDGKWKRKPLPPHWYEIWRKECVLCGRIEEYRVRRLTPKPERYWDRVHYSQDACGEHFL